MQDSVSRASTAAARPWTGRIEDEALVRGLGHYSDDVRPADTSFAAFVRSPHAAADIRGVDTAAARKARQAFLPTAYEKIRRLRSMLADRPVLISVDGGVKAANAGALAQAGATVLVAGSAIFGAADPGAALAALRSASEVPRRA
jgi:CO/xanthine dehydrogenase Mo-binding subunit